MSLMSFHVLTRCPVCIWHASPIRPPCAHHGDSRTGEIFCLCRFQHRLHLHSGTVPDHFEVMSALCSWSFILNKTLCWIDSAKQVTIQCAQDILGTRRLREPTWSFNFPLMQAEWYQSELCVWSCGGHLLPSGHTPGGLPLHHPHTGVWRHARHCGLLLFAAAWNAQPRTPWPRRSQVSPSILSKQDWNLLFLNSYLKVRKNISFWT